MNKKIRKISREEIKTRLSTVGIQIVDDFDELDLKSSSLFECKNGHRWSGRVKNAIYYGCSYCSGHQLSIEIVSERLKLNNIQLLGEYKGANVESLFECLKCGHRWTATVHGCLKKNGCKICSGWILTRESINKRLAEDGSDIRLVGEYTSSIEKSKFRCSTGHEWFARVNGILQGHGCPGCAYYGFKSEKSAHVYLIKFETFIKYGITTNLEKRLRILRRNGEFDVLLTYECIGYEARQLEREIKKQFGGRYASKLECPDGWTETLSIDNVSQVISLIESKLV